MARWRFEWDEHNVQHIARHGVGPTEVEQAADGSPVVGPRELVKGEWRQLLFGKTAAGRYLRVCFTLRGGKFRTVTAHPMDRQDRKNYAAKIGK
ncbi:MAG: BrnT family toxin [Bryobacteraceae bacterium]